MTIQYCSLQVKTIKPTAPSDISSETLKVKVDFEHSLLSCYVYSKLNSYANFPSQIHTKKRLSGNECLTKCQKDPLCKEFVDKYLKQGFKFV